MMFRKHRSIQSARRGAHFQAISTRPVIRADAPLSLMGMKEEERAMAITHWDALIMQWKEEQKTSRFNYKSATQREQRFYEIERTKALQELEKGQSPKGERQVAFELREGQGSLFENRDKKNDRHPDFKGDVKIGGKTYRLAAWTKQTKAGKLFYSLQVDKLDLPAATDGSDVARAMPKEDEDEIRF